jgi:hypothetical protein
LFSWTVLRIGGFDTESLDAKALAARLVQMLSDDALRQNIGLQAAEAASCRFDLCWQADIYLDWYQELANSERLRHGQGRIERALARP